MYMPRLVRGAMVWAVGVVVLGPAGSRADSAPVFAPPPEAEIQTECAPIGLDPAIADLGTPPVVAAPILPGGPSQLVPQVLAPVEPGERERFITDGNPSAEAAPLTGLEQIKLAAARAAIEASRRAGTLEMAPLPPDGDRASRDEAETIRTDEARRSKLELRANQEPAPSAGDPAADPAVVGATVEPVTSEAAAPRSESTAGDAASAPGASETGKEAPAR